MTFTRPGSIGATPTGTEVETDSTSTTLRDTVGGRTARGFVPSKIVVVAGHSPGAVAVTVIGPRWPSERTIASALPLNARRTGDW